MINKEEREFSYSRVPDRHNIVVKSNKLIQRSRFSLTAQQQKILLYIISLIEPFDEDFKEYEFKITEFCKVCGLETHGDMYSLLKAQIKAISDKSLWIELADGAETLVRWIEKPYINKGDGTIKIRMDRDMKPYLLQIREHFTQYELIHTLNFKSKYSIQLYEYLKSIHYNKFEPYTQILDIEKFKKILGNTYADFKGFHTRALKPAQKEINEYSDILFDYELISEGRKVVSIKITVATKETTDRILTEMKAEKMLDERCGLLNE